jgi:predicted MFS family arabinose efflux permease
MIPSQNSPRVLVALLAVAVFLVRTAAQMSGPLLVALAVVFQTLVAAGQLAAAINLSWALTALVAGPVSDTCGRRRVGLMGLLIIADR